MADTIRDVTIRVSIKNGDASLKVPNFKPAEVSLKSAAASVKTVSKETDEVAKKAKQAADEIERFKKLDEAKLKAVAVGDSFKAAGEGAFTMARGAAFLFTSTDDGFAKMAANIAKVQGGFDLFKGSFETIKGVTEGVVKLKAATGALTVAEALQTGVNTALATSYTAIKTAALGAYAALGPLGAAAAAVAVVGTAIYASWKWFAGPEPAKNIKVTNEALRRMEQHKKNIAEADVQNQRRAAQVEDAFDAGGRSNALENAKTDSMREQAKILGQQFNFEARKASLIKEATKQYEAQVKAVEEQAAFTDATNNGLSLNAGIAQAELEFRTRMSELAKQELDTTKAKGDELTKQKTDQENLLKTTKEKIKAEQDALLSAEAKFGQLTKREQKRVTDIAGRGGPSNKSEAELVQKAGFDSAGQKFFAQRGRDGGFEQASKGLGGKTSEDLKKLETERAQIEARLESVKNTLASNQRRQLELLDEVVNQLEDATLMENRLDQLERKLLMREARKAASKQ